MYVQCLFHHGKCRSAQSTNIINFPICFPFSAVTLLADKAREKGLGNDVNNFHQPIALSKTGQCQNKSDRSNQSEQTFYPCWYCPKKVILVLRNIPFNEIRQVFFIPFVPFPVPFLTHYPKQTIIAYTS